MPSAEEIQHKGLKVSEAQTIMMAKIEELTLLLIQQDRKVENLEKRINELEKIIQNEIR